MLQRMKRWIRIVFLVILMSVYLLLSRISKLEQDETDVKMSMEDTPPHLVSQDEITGSVQAMVYSNKTRMNWSHNFRIIREPLDEFIDTKKTILVCVTTAPQNLDRRMAVRETWGNTKEFQVYFILGTPTGKQSEKLEEEIAKEQEKFNDLVQMDFDDTYRNLTLKSVSLVMWAWKVRWPGRRFVIKADDDVFINSRLLLIRLEQLERLDPGIFGVLLEKQGPHRNPQSKWYISPQEYPRKKYPNFVAGSFYIFCESVLGSLYGSLFSPQYLYLEDVYLTGLVAQKANVSRFKMPFNRDINILGGTRIALLNYTVATHYVTPTAMMKAWWYAEDGFRNKV